MKDIDFIKKMVEEKGEFMITRQLLDRNPHFLFVFGDNNHRYGTGGAAVLRDHDRSYGFITKINPDYAKDSFYTPETYPPVFEKELMKLKQMIETDEYFIYLISKLGSNLANRHGIYEKIIEPELRKLTIYPNVVLLFK